MAKQSKPTIKGEIVQKYLAKYPEWFPKAALARVILKENPHTYDNAEEIRYFIRYYTGKAGERNRDQIKRSKSGSVEQFIRTSAPCGIPDTWAEEKKVYKLPTALKKVGFIADLQAPFHDPKAIDVAFNYLHKTGVDSLFINGDLVDFYQLSEFEKDPRVRKFQEEYENTLELLIFIKQSFPNVPIYYNLDANHEYRYERYMRKKAPELLSLELFQLEDLLMLDNIGIKYIKNVDHIKIGKLPVIHGDTTFRRGSGVSPARTLYLRTKVSCLASHVHRTSEYSDKNFYGEVVTCFTTGMLMHPNVEYCKHVDSYNQGFAVIDVEKNGDYEVHNKKIINGKVF
jgi:hypothetical protein